MKHKGFFANRLDVKDHFGDPFNAAEVDFAKAWEKQAESGHPAGSFVEYLVEKPTERDLQVMATVIQWLGTNVGRCFLLETIKGSKELRQYFDLTN